MKIAKLWRLSKRGYYADLVAFPVLILIGLGVALARGLSWANLLWLADGVTAWTLIEYAAHRLILHGPLWRFHKLHHADPEAYVGAPPWLTLGLAALLTVAACSALGFDHGLGIMLAMGSAYCGYLWLHDAMHHGVIPLRTWRDHLETLHWRHHSRPQGNFGVTSPLWDWVFGTAL